MRKCSNYQLPITQYESNSIIVIQLLESNSITFAITLIELLDSSGLEEKRIYFFITFLTRFTISQEYCVKISSRSKQNSRNYEYSYTCRIFILNRTERAIVT